MKKINKTCLTVILGIILTPASTFAITKNETIYSHIDYNGNPYNTTVSNQLIINQEQEILDYTELKDILNISGNEKFKQKGNELIWENANKDIFYEGATDKQLPIDVDIKYYLNEKEMKPNKMIGKKGKIKIEFSFKNKESYDIKTNGKEETLYTPFITTLGTILDSTKNRNINVTNGKVISNGTSSMVVSLASPGLYESIGYQDLSNFNKIILSYDTTSFSLNTIYIVSTPKLLEEKDLSIFSKMDNIYNNVTKLQESMNKIQEGAKNIENGASTLNDGVGEISTNLKKVNESLTLIKNGSVDLNNGLKQMITSLDGAQSVLAQNNFETSFNKLNNLKVQNQNAINNILATTGKTEEELQNIYMTNDLKSYSGSDPTMLAIKNNYELISLLNYNNQAIDEMITFITSLSDQISNMLIQLKTALNQLENGSSNLTTGLNDLSNGVTKLYNGSIILANGTNSLYEGTKTLLNGTTVFNQEGINKLTNQALSIREYTDKVNQLLKLSEEYKGFTSNNANKTTFIYMIKSTNKKK